MPFQAFALEPQVFKVGIWLTYQAFRVFYGHAQQG